MQIFGDVIVLGPGTSSILKLCLELVHTSGSFRSKGIIVTNVAGEL